MFMSLIRSLSPQLKTGIILLIIWVAYVLFYLGYPALPGNNQQFPLGWWGWFDQGKYLLATNAFTHWDLSPEHHFYPPLYPLLGAIFVHLWSMHPFFIVDSLALLWFAYSFLKISQRYVGFGAASAILILTLVVNVKIFEQFVIPWTTTVAAALFSIGFYGIYLIEERAPAGRDNGVNIGLGVSFLFSLFLGLLVPLRPIDAVSSLPIWVSYVVILWINLKPHEHARLKRILPHLLTLFCGGMLGVLMFFAFNLAVDGSVLGGYFKSTASASGYFLKDLPEKFISLFLDGYSLYLEPKSGLIDHYPWLLISLAGLVYAVIRGDSLLRAIACCILLQFALYLPYGDLLPNGLWRYMNIHYFKWSFPYLGLLAWLFVRYLWRQWSENRNFSIVLFLITGLGMLVILSLRLQLEYRYGAHMLMSRENNRIVTRIDLGKNSRQLDFIDLLGNANGFNEIYFGNHQLWLDGRELTKVHDFRMLPAPWGLRILFIRPVVAQSVKVDFDENLKLADMLPVVRTGIYHYHLGLPKPLWREKDAAITTPYRIGDLIDFSNTGASDLYTVGGWSGPESWGRWTSGTEASIKLHLLNGMDSDLKLILYGGAYVNNEHPEQVVDAKINGKSAARLIFTNSRGDANPQYNRQDPKGRYAAGR